MLTDTQFKKIKQLLTTRMYAARDVNDNIPPRCGGYPIDWRALAEHLGPRPSPQHEIDHIIPVCAFDFRYPEQVVLAYLPDNLRWVTRAANMSKRFRYKAKDLEAFFAKHGYQKPADFQPRIPPDRAVGAKSRYRKSSEVVNKYKSEEAQSRLLRTALDNPYTPGSSLTEYRSLIQSLSGAGINTMTKYKSLWHPKYRAS